MDIGLENRGAAIAAPSGCDRKRHMVAVLGNALHGTDPRAEAMRRDAQSLSPPDLHLSMRLAVGKSLRPISFLIASERYSQLGIYPSLRPLLGEASRYQSDELWRLSLMLADLQWLLSQYPDHKAAWPGWRRFFAAGAASYCHAGGVITNGGERSPSQLLRGLNLTDQQQRQCVLIRRGGAGWIAPHLRACDRASRVLSEEQRQREGRALLAGKLRQRGNHLRRYDLWRYGDVIGPSPSQIARAYSALHGLPISRQLVDKILKNACRDLRQAAKRAAGPESPAA